MVKTIKDQSEEHRQLFMNKYEKKCGEIEAVVVNLKVKSEMEKKFDTFQKLLILKDDAIKTLKDKNAKLSQENKSLLESEENFTFTMNKKVRANLDQLNLRK